MSSCVGACLLLNIFFFSLSPSQYLSQSQSVRLSLLVIWSFHLIVTTFLQHMMRHSTIIPTHMRWLKRPQNSVIAC